MRTRHALPALAVLAAAAPAYPGAVPISIRDYLIDGATPGVFTGDPFGLGATGTARFRAVSAADASITFNPFNLNQGTADLDYLEVIVDIEAGDVTGGAIIWGFEGTGPFPVTFYAVIDPAIDPVFFAVDNAITPGPKGTLTLDFAFANMVLLTPEVNGVFDITDWAGHEAAIGGLRIERIEGSTALTTTRMIGHFETVPDPSPTPDLNSDGVVDSADLGILLAAWGPLP